MRITSFPTLTLALLMLFACNQGKDAENKMEKNEGLEIAKKGPKEGYSIESNGLVRRDDFESF
jgi:hypothetical protein